MGTPGVTPEAAAPASGGLSEVQRIIKVFAAPSETFNDVKRKPSWIVPWLAISVSALLLVFVAGQKIGFEQISQNNMKMRPKQMERMEQMPADQRARAETMSVTMTKGISYSAPITFLLIPVAIMALVLMGTFNFGLGDELKFSSAMSVLMYAFVPTVIKNLLAIVSLYAGASPETFLFQNPVASNLGALVDAVEHPALFAAASALDIFTIWSIILTGIGLSCVTKQKRGTATMVVFAWWAAVTLLGVGITALTA